MQIKLLKNCGMLKIFWKNTEEIVMVHLHNIFCKFDFSS